MQQQGLQDTSVYTDFANGATSDNLLMGRYITNADLYYGVWNGAASSKSWTTAHPVTNGSDNMYEVVQTAGAAGTLTNVAYYAAGTTAASTGSAGSTNDIPNAIARTSNYIGRSKCSGKRILRRRHVGDPAL